MFLLNNNLTKPINETHLKQFNVAIGKFRYHYVSIHLIYESRIYTKVLFYNAIELLFFFFVNKK